MQSQQSGVKPCASELRGTEVNRWLPFEGGMGLDSSEDPKPWKVLHTQYTVAIIRQGAADWAYRGRSFTVRPGTVYVCEPGEVHRTTRVHCPGDFTALFLDERVLTDVVSQLGLPKDPHFKADGVGDEQLWNQVSEFRPVLMGKDSEARVQAFSLLLAALARNSTQLPRGTVSAIVGADTVALEHARRHLADVFYSDPSRVVRLAPIASDLGVSYHALIHDFRRCFGVAPYEYVDALRARYMLGEIRRGPRYRAENLTALALRCGYSDGSHFSRICRRHWGLSPKAIALQLNPAWLVAQKNRRA